MKTSLPLPMGEKKLLWTKEFCDSLGNPFQSAKHWKISFYESDVKYIENVIKKHKLYRIIYKQGIEDVVLDTVEQIRRYKTEIKFLTPFMNDVKCPKSVSNFLYCYIGNLRARLQECGYQLKHLEREQFLLDKWMETCR